MLVNFEQYSKLKLQQSFQNKKYFFTFCSNDFTNTCKRNVLVKINQNSIHFENPILFLSIGEEGIFLHSKEVGHGNGWNCLQKK